MIDHERKTVASVFEENAGSVKIQRDIDSIINGEQEQKPLRLEQFKIEPELNRNGKVNISTIEGYEAEKYKA